MAVRPLKEAQKNTTRSKIGGGGGGGGGGGRKNKLRRRGKEGRKGGGDENLLSDARDAAAHSGIRRSRSNIGIEIVRGRERSEISEVIANSRN